MIRSSVMKCFTYPSLFVIVAVLTTASTCKEDDNDVVANQKLAASLGTGTWRISSYFFDKQDETKDLDGYAFHFNDNNILIAKKGALSVQGSWDTEDSSDGYTKLYMDFRAGERLEELNKGWRVTANSGPKISFDHESSSTGDLYVMVLERN